MLSLKKFEEEHNVNVLVVLVWRRALFFEITCYY